MRVLRRLPQHGFVMRGSFALERERKREKERERERDKERKRERDKERKIEREKARER